MQQKRPLGITLSGTVFIFMGGLGGLVCSQAFLVHDWGMASLHLFWALASVFVGFGLWGLQYWAWKYGQFILAYWMLSQLYFFYTFPKTNGSWGSIVLFTFLFSIPSLFILIYFNLPKVKVFFEETDE